MEDAGDRRVRPRGKRTSAQHARVARFHADARRIGRDVRSRFVHHAHYAEGHAHALQVDAVFQLAVHLHDTERIGKPHEVFERHRHSLDAALVEHKTVEQAFAGTRRASGFHIPFVLGDDLARVVAQRLRHRSERRVARFS